MGKGVLGEAVRWCAFAMCCSEVDALDGCLLGQLRVGLGSSSSWTREGGDLMELRQSLPLPYAFGFMRSWGCGIRSLALQPHHGSF